MDALQEARKLVFEAGEHGNVYITSQSSSIFERDKTTKTTNIASHG
jgi:hypothetical protein